MAETKKNISLLENVDSLPLVWKKFLKYEYLVFYDEAKQNENEIEDLKMNKKPIQLTSDFGIYNEIYKIMISKPKIYQA
jgi:hypothetical protein